MTQHLFLVRNEELISRLLLVRVPNVVADGLVQVSSSLEKETGAWADLTMAIMPLDEERTWASILGSWAPPPFLRAMKTQDFAHGRGGVIIAGSGVLVMMSV